MRRRRTPLRREFLDSKPSDGQEQRVLFLGSINQRKGISDALRAFSEVRIDGWTLHVIGAGTPEAEFGHAKAFGSLGLQNRLETRSSLGVLRHRQSMQASSVFSPANPDRHWPNSVEKRRSRSGTLACLLRQ